MCDSIGATGAGAAPLTTQAAMTAPAGATTQAAVTQGGGGGDLMAMLQQLSTSLQALMAAITGGAAAGGGGAAIGQTTLKYGAAPALAGAGAGAAAGAAVAQAGHSHGAAGAAGGVQRAAGRDVDGSQGSNVPGSAIILNPPTNDPRFVRGTTGPVVEEGDARTVKLEDGTALNGKKARAQNNGDKAQNNYSVTDANFNNQLGVRAGATYNGTTADYSAAGAVQRDPAMAPAYDILVRAQNEATQRGAKAGDPTITEGALALLGLAPEPAWFAQYGLRGGQFADQAIPGTNIKYAAYIATGRDATGQEWARPHHALSSWNAYFGLIDAGVPAKDALVFAGDDGVSGAGRLNGVNNQDGGDSFNAGEIEIWSKLAAEYGTAGMLALSHSHAMTSLDEGALTNPNINKILQGAGYTGARNERNMTQDRAAALVEVLTNGKVGSEKTANANGTKIKASIVKNAQEVAIARGGGAAAAPAAAAPVAAPLAAATPQIAPVAMAPVARTASSY